MLLLQELQAVVGQLQQAQQVQLTGVIHAARAQLDNRTGSGSRSQNIREALDHPHLLRQLLHTLLQAPGDLQGPAGPVQDVLVHLSLQNALHNFPFRFDARHHLIDGGPQGANLRGPTPE